MNEENVNEVVEQSQVESENQQGEKVEGEVETQPTAKKGRRPKSEGIKVTGKINSNLFVESLAEISKESLVSAETISDILLDAMRQAYLEMSYPGIFKNKDSDDPAKDKINVRVCFNDKMTKFSIADLKTVVRESEDDLEDPAYQISLEEAKKVTKRAKIGDEIAVPLNISDIDPDRVSILTKEFMKRVKQLFTGKLKESSRNAILTNYKDQMGGLITGTVTKADSSTGNYEISFGKAEGFLRKMNKNMLPNDVFTTGDIVTCFLEKVNDNTNPPSLLVTRSNPGFVVKLMEREIPEIATGQIKIKGVAREAGKRTKVFVQSTRANIDPVGTCIGPDSSRQRAISSVLKSEKVEFAKYSINKAVQIINAMVPADIIGIVCLDDFFDSNVHYEEFENDRSYIHPEVTVIVNNGAQGTAIGSDGSNVRLASKLTKCKITVMQIDEAMKQGVHPIMTPEILKMAAEFEKQQMLEDNQQAIVEQETVKTSSNQLLPEEDNLSDLSIPTSSIQSTTEVVSSTPVESKPLASDSDVEHVEIKNKPKISLEQLEKQLENANKKKQSNYSKNKKKYKDDEEEEKKPTVNLAVGAMPIYSEDELEDLDQDNEDNDYSDYYNEEDEEYDSDYESYYEDEN